MHPLSVRYGSHVGARCAATGRGAVEKRFGLKWADHTLKNANTIANFLNDSGPAKFIVHRLQDEIYHCRKQIVVNVPTRFATNFLVLQSVHDSKQAIIQAVSTEAWAALGGKAQAVKDIAEHQLPDASFFWENVVMLLELLRPFADAIHQLEADRPMLGQCHEALVTLRKHVSAYVTKYKDARDGDVVERLQETFDRRLTAVGGGALAPIYNAAYTAAFLLDPMNAVLSAQDKHYHLPAVDKAWMEAAITLVERVGGQPAAAQLRELQLTGYPDAMTQYVAVIASKKPAPTASAEPDAATSGGPARKRQKVERAELPPMYARVNVWLKHGAALFPELCAVVQRLLTCHATSCATERNWSLWGRVYCASRNALAMEKAKKLIAICTSSRQQAQNDFALSLQIVEGDV
jgi:hypothetical protein